MRSSLRSVERGASRRRCSPIGLAATGSLLTACSLGYGGVLAPSVHPDHTLEGGVFMSSVADVSICDCTMNLAAGVQSQLMQRVGDGTKWGDWRLQAVLGATKTPRPHEFRIGYEVFLLPGAARYHMGDEPELGFALGALGAFPIRLSSTKPTWRADDLVGLSYYLVPSIGANWLGFERLEGTFGLAFRIHLWSAIAP